MFNPISILLKKQDLLIRITAAAILLASTIGLFSRTVSAQTTYVITDGDRVVIHTTDSTDPKTVLDEAGLELDAADSYTTQSGAGVSEITVQRGQSVSISLCGRTLEADTFGETVESLLARLDVVLDDYTEVSVPLDTMTYDGMELQVNRTVRCTERYTTVVPHDTIYCQDASLPAGTVEVLKAGVDGEMQCTADVVYLNGQETTRIVLQQTVTSQPVEEVIAVGIGDPSVEPEPRDPNMPIILDGIIILPTGEVLTYSGTMAMVATAYTHTDEGCDFITATGTTVHIGTVAVDTRLIPYGTRMFIITDDGEYIYGLSTAEDCGSSIKGNRVDLYFPTTWECFQFGVRDCTVYILG